MQYNIKNVQKTFPAIKKLVLNNHYSHLEPVMLIFNYFYISSNINSCAIITRRNIPNG